MRETNLGNAILDGANLQHTNLSKSILNNAHISEANLYGSNLHEANLDRAILRRTNLYRVRLYGASLVGADLCGTNLYNADIWRANAGKANLKDADLRYCDLNQTNFTEAILTGVRLYGTGRDDWDVSGVTSRYVYWDEEGEQRSPKDRDLEPGEFERLYAALPTIEYIFENGMTPMDPLIMDRVVQAIREKQPEFDIKIDSINARGLAPSIKFTVQHEEQKESALKEVRKEYEIKIKQLETERDRYWEEIQRALDKPREVKLITAGPGAIVAMDGSTVNIQQHIHNALALQKAITDEPEGSKSFAKVAKKTALEIVGEVIKDIAKGQVKEAAKQIIELGKDLGPLLVKVAPVAYEFFRSIGT